MPVSGGKETGWVNKFALEAGALAADATGRQAIEDGFFSAESTMRAKFAAGFITVDMLSATLLSLLLEVGRIDYSGVDYCKIG